MRKTLLVAVIGFAALSVTASLGMAQQKGKVLMIVNEGKSEDLELMLTGSWRDERSPPRGRF